MSIGSPRSVGGSRYRKFVVGEKGQEEEIKPVPVVVVRELDLVAVGKGPVVEVSRLAVVVESGQVAVGATE